ncbi:hypothetical protein Bbelb_010230 [Branchiostoma belcheri]|nr:hypothetical protein Bbelb_010230 [Branchiostoma belcheri]
MKPSLGATVAGRRAAADNNQTHPGGPGNYKERRAPIIAAILDTNRGQERDNRPGHPGSPLPLATIIGDLENIRGKARQSRLNLAPGLPARVTTFPAQPFDWWFLQISRGTISSTNSPSHRNAPLYNGRGPGDASRNNGGDSPGLDCLTARPERMAPLVDANVQRVLSARTDLSKTVTRFTFKFLDPATPWQTQFRLDPYQTV